MEYKYFLNNEEVSEEDFFKVVSPIAFEAAKRAFSQKIAPIEEKIKSEHGCIRVDKSPLGAKFSVYKVSDSLLSEFYELWSK